jgi:cyclophilin family peptidyl-prolyl cis-trans isomerase
MTRLVLPAFILLSFALFLVACAGAGGSGEPQTFEEACQKTDRKEWSSPPDQIIEPSKTYLAIIRTAKGDITLELFNDVPVTTNNFVFLACKGFYDGLTFHQVDPQVAAEGGDPNGDCTGGPGYTIPDEDDDPYKLGVGVISMAKSGPDTAGSRFFITYRPQPDLDPDFTVFGRITSQQGMSALLNLTPRDCTDPDASSGDLIGTIVIAVLEDSAAP